MQRPISLLAVAAVVTLTAAAANATTIQSTKKAPYHPKVVPSNFTHRVTNRYFPLAPGTTWVYTGTKDGAPERVEVTVKQGTKTIMGVRCVIISDVVTSNYTLVEKTFDWYAQDKAGNVWYFGEDSKEYKNGVVVSTQGTWEAGVDNALPGIVMHAVPKVGTRYRQEYRPGVAEDMAKMLHLHLTKRVPAGSYRDVRQTFDADPLNPDKLEHKWYAPGVGLIEAHRFGGQHKERIKLVEMKKPA